MKKRELKNRSVASKPAQAASATQLELILPATRSAAILSFIKPVPQTALTGESKRVAPSVGPDSSKRILDFAATLPDW